MIHEKPALGQRIFQKSGLPKIDIEKDKPREIPLPLREGIHPVKWKT